MAKAEKNKGSLRKGPRRSPFSGVSARQALIKAATRVFAKLGHDGATVKDIAEASGLNVSLISYYFNGKEGLYRACLENFGRERLKAAEKILTGPDSPEDFNVKLKLWIEHFLDCLVEEQELSKILHMEFVSEMHKTKDIFQSTFLQAYEALVKFFQSAQAKKIIRSEVDCLIAALMVYGSILNRVNMDFLSKEFYGVAIEDEKTRKEFIGHTLTILLHGIA